MPDGTTVDHEAPGGRADAGQDWTARAARRALRRLPTRAGGVRSARPGVGAAPSRGDGVAAARAGHAAPDPAGRRRSASATTRLAADRGARAGRYRRDRGRPAPGTVPSAAGGPGCGAAGEP